MGIWFGWRELFIDVNGYPTDEETDWKASCFIFFTHVIYIGEVKPA